MIVKKVFYGWMMVCLLMSLTYFGANNRAHAAVINSIPNTSRVVKSYDRTFLSVPGYASLGVKDRSSYIGTSYYRAVSTPREFLQSILDAKNGSVKVIEVRNDLNMGWNAISLNSTEKSTYSFITQYPDPMNGFTNPEMATSGVSKLNMGDINGLTIFSTSGSTISHVEMKLNRPSNDIIIRNLKFDDMW